MRHARRIAAALVLGVASSVAVAWLIAGLTPVPSGRRHTTGAFVRWDRAWNAVEAYRFGLVHTWWSGTLNVNAAGDAADLVGQMRAEAAEVVRAGKTEFPLTLRNEHRPWGTFASETPPPAEFNMGSDSGYGWPRPCLYHRVFTVYDPRTASTVRNSMDGGLVLFGAPASRWDGYRALPLRPIGRGLAINSILYALLWSVPLFVPGLIRSRHRHGRGLCARCGYDLRGSSSGDCPECGPRSGAGASR